MVTKIFLIRHGEAEGNAVPFFQGGIDTPLTEKGLRQIGYLAERFREIPLDAIYFSPFRRAELTAEAVNKYHGLNMIPEYDLRELNGGSWEGRRISDIRIEYPAEFAVWTTHMQDFQAPNGDAMTEVYARMRGVLQKIAEENPGRTVAVFTHGCALRNFLSFAEYGSISGLHAVGWGDNSAVSLVEYDPEAGWKLIYKNDSSHLPQDAHTAMPV